MPGRYEAKRRAEHRLRPGQRYFRDCDCGPCSEAKAEHYGKLGVNREKWGISRDTLASELRADGYDVHLRRCEIELAVRILLDRGELSSRRIAVVVGCSPRTVWRVAARMREGR